jgi:putative ABC transport system permease protein
MSRRLRARASRAGTLGLLVRTIAPQLSITAVIALLTLIVALCCGLVPRAMAALSASDLTHSVTGLADPRRDVSGTVTPFLIGDAPGTPAPDGSAQQAFGRLDSALAKAKQQASGPLRSVLGDPHVVARAARKPAHAVTPVDAKGDYFIALAADPRYERQLTLTSGALPQRWVLPDATETSSGGLSNLQGDASAAPPIELAISAQTAKQMNLAVGDVFLTAVSEFTVRVQISGVFDPLAPHSDYWQNTPSIVSPIYEPGINGPDVYTATGFVNPGTLTAFEQAGVFNGTFWFPVAAGAVTADNARGVAAGIAALQARQISIPAAEPGQTVRVPVKTDLGTVIGQSIGRIAATLAVIAVLASGPAGVVIAVFALGVRAVLERRAPVLALLAARGASPGRLRAAAAVEGLAAGLPAAVVGAVIAARLLPGPDASAWVAPVLAGLVPAVLFAVFGGGAGSAFGGGRGFRGTRRDLSARARGGARWVVEACVVGAAAIATFLLVRRGPVAGAGVDPLLALTPLLLALAVSVVVLRLLPLAVRAGFALARRRRGPVGFIGAARAMRDPALGVAAALAVVVGVSIAVLSSGVLATVEIGAHTTAVAAVGADVRADSAVFDAKVVAATRRAPGVAHVAGTMTAGNLDLGLNGRTSTVQPLVTDSRALHAVRADVPADLAAKVGGRVPVIVSADLLDEHPVGAKQRLGDVPVVIAGALPAGAQLGADSRWVLVDKAYANRLSGSPFEATRLFVSLNAGASPAPVEKAITAAAPYSVVTDARAAVAAIDAAPAASGLRLALVVGAVGSALLAAIAVFAGSVTAGASRNSAIAMLRTMGLTGRQSLGLVVWEIVPLVVAAAAVGLALGLALPHLLVATTDFAPFTGGAAHLAVATDWGRLAWLLAGVLGVAALATLVAVLVARRTDPTGTVKMGAE